MSKVKLNLTEKQLSALVYSFNQASKAPVKDRIARVAKSVLDKTALSFKKRQLEVQQNSNLFTKEKKYTFSLELVEAHFLEQYLISMTTFPMNDYDKNVINQISSTLNQKMA